MKSRVPLRKLGLILTGPHRWAPKMFGGPVSVPNIGRQLWATGPTIDQKNESACVGFAWEGFLMAEPEPFPVPDDTFAFGVQVYRSGQKLDEYEGEEPEYYGTTIEAGHEALLRMGLVKNEILWAGSISQIIKHLLEVGPVVMGTEWTNSMMHPDEEGWIAFQGGSMGGHAFLCYGVDIPSKTLFFLNSWGPSFGLGGKFKMMFRTVERLLARGGYGLSTFEEAK